MATAPIFGEIYLHYCPISQKGYVGQTRNGLVKRWCDQVKVTRWKNNPAYKYPLSNAIRKYGKDAFEHQVLAVAKTKQELDNLEKVWIILLQSREHGYNLAIGGEGNPGLKHTPESKAKISKNRTGKALGLTFNRGRVRTEETRRKISDSTLGLKRSSDTCERIRKARTGVKRPDVVIANKKRWANPETRLHQSEKLKSRTAGLLLRNGRGQIIGRKEE